MIPLAQMHRLRHVDTKQAEMLSYASATLGSGNLREAVKLPQGEDPNEWIAVNGTYTSVDNQESLWGGVVFRFLWVIGVGVFFCLVANGTDGEEIGGAG